MLKTCEKNAIVFQKTSQSRWDDHVFRVRLQPASASITCLGLPRSKLRIDQLLAEEEQRRLPEAFNTFFEIFEAAEKDGKNGKNVIQKAVGSLPREVKNKIYGKIFEADGNPKTKDGLYGENHVVDNLPRLKGIVMEVQAEMEEKTRAEQGFSFFSHVRSAPLQLPPAPNGISGPLAFSTPIDLRGGRFPSQHSQFPDHNESSRFSAFPFSLQRSKGQFNLTVSVDTPSGVSGGQFMPTFPLDSPSGSDEEESDVLHSSIEFF